MARRRWRRRGRMAARAAQPPGIEDIAARAARLGITPERVLEEYARIAFASLRDIASWGPDGLEVKPSGDLTPAEVAAIAEIVAAAGSGRVYRIKLHDKKPVLDAIARHLGMRENEPDEDELSEEDGESARQLLIREFDRLAAEAAEGSGAPEPDR
jgi:hypothetical protein